MLYISAIVLNLIVLLVFMIPSIICCFYKTAFSSKRKLLYSISIIVVINVILSALFYKFAYNVFGALTSNTGKVNLSVYIARILFLDSSIYSLRILLPVYLFKQNKKTAIFVLSKIAVQLVLTFICYSLFSVAGLIYSFPLCNIIYYFIYIFLFIRY